MNMSGVTIKFIAHHLDAERDEGWHEHKWKVTAWFPAVPWEDGRKRRERLTRAVESIIVELDGVRQLPASLWSNEALARHLLGLPGIVRIDVKRRGFKARLYR